MNLKTLYSKKDVLSGALVYPIGDFLASAFLNQYSIIRIVGMMVIGGLIYSLEIPNFFKWIDSHFDAEKNSANKIYRVLLALFFFNPIWIARHLIFINLLMGKFSSISISIIYISFISFLWNIPISIIANYIIQNKIIYKWRFLSSAIFSGIMTLYYALSQVWFS
jgi:hypothetical protein